MVGSYPCNGSRYRDGSRLKLSQLGTRQALDLRRVDLMAVAHCKIRGVILLGMVSRLLQTAFGCWKVFKEQLYIIPGNGKRIKLWEDKIMGLHPLNLAPDMANLRNWLIQKGIQKLVDICTWDSEGNWSKWDLHCPPWLDAPSISSVIWYSLVWLLCTCIWGISGAGGSPDLTQPGWVLQPSKNNNIRAILQSFGSMYGTHLDSQKSTSSVGISCTEGPSLEKT